MQSMQLSTGSALYMHLHTFYEGLYLLAVRSKSTDAAVP